ncbi:MAG: helix-turn-helix transcriptional regulator [Candidatus Thermoplasmatota archaeon]|nr:helix-turn-helix transcriptional regulator [Candidatus Thermoplasmatota archaeon]
MRTKQMTGDEIRRERIAMGLTQVGLAEALGVSTIAVESWEQGRRTPPPDLADRLRALREKLGVAP